MKLRGCDDASARETTAHTAPVAAFDVRVGVAVGGPIALLVGLGADDEPCEQPL